MPCLCVYMPICGIENPCPSPAADYSEDREQEREGLRQPNGSDDVSRRASPHKKAKHAVQKWMSRYSITKAMMTSRAKSSLFDAARRGDPRLCHQWEQSISTDNPEGSSLYWNRRDARDRTPLMIASAGQQHGHKDVVDFLLSRNANVHAVDKYGQTALHHAVKFRTAEHTTTVNRVRVDTLVQSLVDHGANVLARDHEGLTPFEIALGHGNVAAMNVLVQAATTAGKSSSGELGFDPRLEEEGLRLSANGNNYLHNILDDVDPLSEMCDKDHKLQDLDETYVLGHSCDLHWHSTSLFVAQDDTKRQVESEENAQMETEH